MCNFNQITSAIRNAAARHLEIDYCEIELFTLGMYFQFSRKIENDCSIMRQRIQIEDTSVLRTSMLKIN